MTSPLLSICVPSYNRAAQLGALLRSVDCMPEQVEIVICEDKAPRRHDVRAQVEAFSANSPYPLTYEENAKNLGFDGNIRKLVGLARGHFILFMGDDDLFLEHTLDRYLSFLDAHRTYAYVLRSYVSIHADGRVEAFKYLPGTTILPAGEDTVAWLFKRSVSLCGFTISREAAQQFPTNALDGTLLYQVYLMAQTCLRYPSVYCDITVGHAVQSFRADAPMFGASEAERGRYTPGKVTEDNSINFSASYFEVTQHLDDLNNTKLTSKVRKDLSRYSYPFLSIQRKRGIGPFLAYASRLDKELGFGCTAYFHIYKWMLVLFGERACDFAIVYLKKLIGHTPQLR